MGRATERATKLTSSFWAAARAVGDDQSVVVIFLESLRSNANVAFNSYPHPKLSHNRREGSTDDEGQGAANRHDDHGTVFESGNCLS
jgi:hypothetical protein